ncbi:hypothetical protein RJT34_27538 [Clitoria ternatea]|uniref:FAR1 domain-containing protein n=1 Tax=Clitoria ternatea TaxID=43366 RepID=A0AAN9I9S6_CLITE
MQRPLDSNRVGLGNSGNRGGLETLSIEPPSSTRSCSSREVSFFNFKQINLSLCAFEIIKAVFIMDIDLRLPSGEHDKEDEETTTIDNMLDSEEKLHNGGIDGRNIVDTGIEVHALNGGDLNSPTVGMVMFKEDTNLEPLSGMEFESHGEAYSFYQEYARSMGFNTAIQNSRRSKTSREFIDAKFACSRYGTKREYDKSFNRPRARQNKQDSENSTGRRSCSKTDCKASMHVKRRPDGKWVIHSFVKEHNHELLPAQAVSEQTRRMYAAMARQFAEYKTVILVRINV